MKMSRVEPTFAVVTEPPPPPVVQSEPIVETTDSEITINPATPLDALTIETKLGGLFYLINLAIFLEILQRFHESGREVSRRFEYLGFRDDCR